MKLNNSLIKYDFNIVLLRINANYCSLNNNMFFISQTALSSGEGMLAYRRHSRDEISKQTSDCNWLHTGNPSSSNHDHFSAFPRLHFETKPQPGSYSSGVSVPRVGEGMGSRVVSHLGKPEGI